MKEQEQGIVKLFPSGLKPQDRLFLEMAVADDDIEKARRLARDYGIEIPEDSTPLGLCQNWLAGLKRAEKRHCQNILDLHSQEKSIGVCKHKRDLLERRWVYENPSFGFRLSKL